MSEELSAPAPIPTPACPVCLAPPFPGAKRCGSHLYLREGGCLVGSCAAEVEVGGRFCAAHLASLESQDKPFLTWLAAQGQSPPPPLPAPSVPPAGLERGITTHGIPAGEDAETVGAALLEGTRAGLASLEAEECDEGQTLLGEFLIQLCMFGPCEDSRHPGSPFCLEHQDAGMRALHEEHVAQHGAPVPAPASEVGPPETITVLAPLTLTRALPPGTRLEPTPSPAAHLLSIALAALEAQYAAHRHSPDVGLWSMNLDAARDALLAAMRGPVPEPMTPYGGGGGGAIFVIGTPVIEFPAAIDPRPLCCAGDCAQPRAPGHALCGAHHGALVRVAGSPR